MMSLFNPAVPLVHSIPGGYLHPGQSIIIQGEPLSNCNRFCVNLIEQSSSDCIFHFDFRFDQNTTVRNCNFHSSWGQEERSPLPIQKGQFFYMEIRATEDRYLVAVNGKHHSEFMYRVPSSAADALQIQGDVRIHSVEFRGFPSPSGHPCGFHIHRLHAAKPALPFVSSMNGHLADGGEVQVYGRVKRYANRFSVNLQQGTRIDGSQIIALHVNPRFEGGNRIVVLNSKTGGWAEEKRIEGSNNPFHLNGQFVLTVRRQADHFDIFVNGAHFKTFKHRMCPNVINAVYIEGDVDVERVLVI